MPAAVLQFRDPQWLAKRLTVRAIPRKNSPGLHAEHADALAHYRSLPWHFRARKHIRAWVSNRHLSLRQWLRAQGY